MAPRALGPSAVLGCPCHGQSGACRVRIHRPSPRALGRHAQAHEHEAGTSRAQQSARCCRTPSLIFVTVLPSPSRLALARGLLVTAMVKVAAGVWVDVVSKAPRSNVT